MKTDTCSSRTPAMAGGLLLLMDPRKFFSGLPREDNGAWRYLLWISLTASALGFFGGTCSGNLTGLLVFFVNAVGMTLIFTGAVFLFARIVLRRACSFGDILSICAYASLGPILISWIPGAMWISEPWRWWVSAAGIGAWTGAGGGKAAGVVGLGVAFMYLLMRALLFIV